MERLSKLDPLTGVGSGDWLATERWPAALRSGRPLGVVYLDLDHLKLTNDAKGHGAGDEYIRTAADTLARAVRRGVDEIFRTHRAGDEFEVLLHGPVADLNRCAWSILQRLAERGVSASLGFAYTTVTDYVPARAELRLAAEAACREAKKLGGGSGILAGQGLVTAPEISLDGMCGNSPSIAAQLQADGQRIKHKREAIGWTRSQVAALCQTTAVILEDLELGRRPVAQDTQDQIEACLDAELATRSWGR